MAAVAENLQIPEELDKLSQLIETSPEVLATGSKDLQIAALNATKYVFDLALKSEAASRKHIAELLTSISPAQAPKTRSQTKAIADGLANGAAPALPSLKLEPTPLTSLFVDGMHDGQIWAQLDLRAKNVCATLEHALEDTVKDFDDESSGPEDDEDDDDDDDEGMEGLEGMGGFGFNEEDEEEEDESEEEDSMKDVGEDAEEQVTGLRDPSDDSDDEDAMDLDRPSRKGTLWDKIAPKLSAPKWKSGGHPELDDGFFSLAEFNAETEETEAKKVTKGGLSKSTGDDETDSDEDLDEDIDLFAPVDDAEGLDPEIEEEVEEPYYRDFFEPPPREPKKSKPNVGSPPKASRVRFHDEVRVKSIKARGKGLSVSAMNMTGDDEDDDEDYAEDGDKLMEDDMGGDGSGDESDGSNEDEAEAEGDSDTEVATNDEDEDVRGRDAIERLKDDLFAEEDEDETKALSTGTDLSTHEKRMEALRAQIAELEAENVGKKDWVLMGEATARSRPQNSLLEEDLDFERVMKAVPVVTESSVQALEDRIKARILDNNFDDVVRRRPVEDKPFLPSRLIELQDKKSKQSLAEIYEEEYVTAASGVAAGDDRDGKLKKEHEEIEKMWDGICYKLDALCNAHFTPKLPKATIETVSNVAAATLESALPTTKATTTMLAPEEVFAPSSSDVRARSELTPAEKRSLHNKQKKAKKQARDALERRVGKVAQMNTGSKHPSSVKKQKEEALKSVVKSGKGVTVIGKKSKQTEGKKRKET
ncbi:Mpp10 protein [Punctularia strigosozonata HHB-11173 SS5]|uniref:Mpp10 protein n=1 Tax=Punctularia strigosozonata (strain HHB-11173) TaxID=741275 RepID=UPI0004418011|nr:Mpp10 protein [Punctularia strigosozonata HHB-11173 SS5]EIN13712.1 Mpp10 protein [Punctularia strigosozonata HHB-11173 SS5]